MSRPSDDDQPPALPHRVTSTPALTVTTLDAPFGSRDGLRGISLEVAAGERVVLLGPSGTGKTTLLRTIAGLSAATAGRLVVAGRDVTRLPPEQRGAVYLHQTPLLFPHLDVAGNVAFSLRLQGRSRPDDAHRIEAALQRVQLDGFGARRVQTLSGGQQQRVALARALIAAAPVLLLDEPLSALDPELRQDVRDALVRASAEPHQPALLLVTHDLDDAGLLGDRVGVMLDGQLVQLAPPAELFARPATLGVARYLGWPTMLAGTLEADGTARCALGVVRPGRSVVPADAAPGTPVIIAARADAMVPDAAGTVEAHLERVRVRPDGTTGQLCIGAERFECAAAEGAAPGPLRVRVHEMRLHLFPAPPTQRG